MSLPQLYLPCGLLASVCLYFWHQGFCVLFEVDYVLKAFLCSYCTEHFYASGKVLSQLHLPYWLYLVSVNNFYSPDPITGKHYGCKTWSQNCSFSSLVVLRNNLSWRPLKWQLSWQRFGWYKGSQSSQNTLEEMLEPLASLCAPMSKHQVILFSQFPTLFFAEEESIRNDHY